MVQSTEQISPPQLAVGQAVGLFEVVAPLRTRYGQQSEARVQSRPRTQSRPHQRGEQALRTVRGGQADLYLVRPLSAASWPRRWLAFQRMLLGESPALVQRYQLGVLKITEPRYTQNIMDELDYLFRVEHPRLIRPYSLQFPNLIPAHQARRPMLYRQSGVDYPYIILAYASGGSLLDYLRARGGGKQALLSPGQAVEIAAQVGEVLQVLHEARVVHRDIAPANLVFHRPISALRPQQPEVVLIDLAAANSFPRQRLREPWGRWRYLPPESQPRQRSEDPEPQNSPQTDIYMLGLLLYELMTGALDAQSVTQRRDRTYREKPIAARNPAVTVSPELQSLVAHAIERDVEVRRSHLPTMGAFVARLRALPEAAQERRLRGVVGRRHLAAAMLSALLVLIVALGGISLNTQAAPAPPRATPVGPGPRVTATLTYTAVPPTITAVPPTITSVPRP